jgi:hypothetical protein
MDTLPSPAGDLNELEQRLSEWQPSAAGLDAGSMLFAAGRASVRPGWGRRAWPIVSGCLAVALVGLGVALSQERAARLEMVAKLTAEKPVVLPAPSTVPEPGPVAAVEPPALHSYLAARRALEDVDAWLVPMPVEPTPGPPLPNRAIWSATSSVDVVDQ